MKTNKYVSKRQSIQLLNVNIHVGDKMLNIYSSYFNTLTPQKLNRYYNVESDRNKRHFKTEEPVGESPAGGVRGVEGHFQLIG